MARKSGSTIVQEELYPSSSAPAREEIDDARLVDLDVDEESPFLRGQKRVSARRGKLPKKTASILLWATLIGAALCGVGVVAAGIYQYGERSWRFRVDSSDDIEVIGTQNVTKAQIMEVMGSDIGRNIFFIPLEQQRAQLEQIPWVESASVMRFVPNHLKVEIEERTPVAFARVGPRIALIDAGGTLMDLSTKHKYSFPVILGMNPGEPLSTRAPRMKAYNELIRELDSSGAHYSQELSEVDLGDLDDLKVRVNDPAGDVLVHLGSSNYLPRYSIYVTHAREWRQQFQKLESVDLRYDNQIVVNPDMQGTVKSATLKPAAAKTAIAAGVKPAALKETIPKDSAHEKPLPKPAYELSEDKLHPKPETANAKKAAAKNSAAKTSSAKTKWSAKANGKTNNVKTAKPGAVTKTGAVSKTAKTKATNSATKQKPNPAARNTAAHSPAEHNPAHATTNAQAHKPVAKPAATAANHGPPKPSPAVAKKQSNDEPSD
jgi:cell division protein FtsQ